MKGSPHSSRLAILIGIVIGLLLFNWFLHSRNQDKPKPPVLYSQVVKEIRKSPKDIKEIRVERLASVSVVFKNTSRDTLTASYPDERSLNELVQEIDKEGIALRVEPQKSPGVIRELLISIVPLFLFLGLMLFVLSRTSGVGKIFKSSFRREKLEEETDVTFNDVAGIEEVREEVQEVVDFLHEPERFLKLGAKVPKGVLLVGAPGNGKCVVGDTLVTTNKGIIPIKDVPRYYHVDANTNKVHGAKLASVDIGKESYAMKSASHWYDLGEQNTIKVTTRNHTVIEGTPEHPVAVFSVQGNMEWKRLDSITTSDFLVMKANSQAFGYDTRLSVDDAYMLGLLAGDGAMKGHEDKEIKDFFYWYIETRWPGTTIYSDKNSREIKQHFIDLDTESVPEAVMMGTKDIVTAFLQGLFDSDGCMEKYQVTHTTTSDKLHRQTVQLLLNLGIYSNVSDRKQHLKNGYKTSWKIQISAQNLRLFDQMIGSRLSRKQILVDKYLAKKNVGNTNIDIFPHLTAHITRIWNQVVANRDILSPNDRKELAIVGKYVSRSKRSNRITRASLTRVRALAIKSGLAHDTDVQHIGNLLDMNIIVSSVRHIESGFARVYDFTVPETHSFLANGIVSHNTLTAKAIANESGATFYSLTGSDLVEIFAGLGASVTGDTKVLVNDDKGKRLIPISEAVDPHFTKRGEGYKKVTGLKTIGYVGKTNRMDKPSWVDVEGVYRHKVNELYTINFTGGQIKTTGDHSIFVRRVGSFKEIAVRDIKKGDILVRLPHKVGCSHLARITPLDFDTQYPMVKVTLPVGTYTQEDIVKRGWSESEALTWLDNRENVIITDRSKPIPEELPLTPELSELIGYYLAEGSIHQGRSVRFNFSADEEFTFVARTQKLLKDIFGLDSVVDHVVERHGRLVVVHSKQFHDAMVSWCGSHSLRKRVPNAFWQAPFDSFVGLLQGYCNGDGHEYKGLSKDNKGLMQLSSANRDLLVAFSWLFCLHGLGAPTPLKCVSKEHVLTRRDGKEKLMKESIFYRLTVGRTSNPLSEHFKNCASAAHNLPSITRAIVHSVTKETGVDQWVYDLCGCDNEAFFGGDVPILLHNSRVRKLFKEARASAPSIIFIDEIDAIGRTRSGGGLGGNEEREQTLNQLLSEMDGFENSEGVVVIAATNRPEILDAALLRPGRFDRQIMIDRPDVVARAQILRVHARSKPIDDKLIEELAKQTPGFSGAELANLLNEAALHAARREAASIEKKDLNSAILRVIAGLKKERLMSPEERKIVAYHEVGHALCSHFTGNPTPVQKISIISRGRALGFTMSVPERDRLLETRESLMDQLTLLMGGRAAEIHVFGSATSGATNDLLRATDIAWQMVTRYGLSDKVGPRMIASPEETYSSPGAMGALQCSPQLAQLVDDEILVFIKEAQEKAEALLATHDKLLHSISSELMEHETIEGTHFLELLGEEEIGTNPNGML